MNPFKWCINPFKWYSVRGMDLLQFMTGSKKMTAFPIWKLILSNHDGFSPLRCLTAITIYPQPPTGTQRMNQNTTAIRSDFDSKFSGYRVLI